ncbi:hypothetical protein [Paenibacillus wulumuqiensis]|uniref:hypothetical protein n=1 Tax=Paenibacillus wulumuqiensis TaxID=1567107 RepID=UPI0006197C0C|nr:hypothetical protein [Paenibacillus wulumuqiensis]
MKYRIIALLMALFLYIFVHLNDTNTVHQSYTYKQAAAGASYSKSLAVQQDGPFYYPWRMWRQLFSPD